MCMRSNLYLRRKPYPMRHGGYWAINRDDPTMDGPSHKRTR